MGRKGRKNYATIIDTNTPDRHGLVHYVETLHLNHVLGYVLGGGPGLGRGGGGRYGGGGPVETIGWREGFMYANMSDMMTTKSANEGRSSALRRVGMKEKGMTSHTQNSMSDLLP